MDAPSWTPDWEPFYDQPMMEDTFANLQVDFWAGEGGVAPAQFVSAQSKYDMAEPPRNDIFENGLQNLGGVYIQTDVGFSQTNSLHLLPSGEVMPNGVQDLTQAYNPQQLAALPESQLEAIAQNVAEALEARKQKRLEKSIELVKEHPSQDTIKEKQHHAHQISKSKTPKLECEHQGCTVTFRRKKDRTRHFRHKHLSHPGFQCPIVDCPLGTGHEISRSDKLRDHLKGNAASSRTWRCVLPGCLETAIGRDALIHHIWRHDGDARRRNMRLLANYGLLNPQSPGYSMLEFICARGGCPFGANSLEVIEKHRLIPHNGPTCQCPIPDCQLMSKDWEETSMHLARDHSGSARMLYRADIRYQGFHPWRSAFSCPICQNTFLNPGLFADQVRQHCLSHGFEDLLAKAQAIVEAFRFYWSDDYIWSPTGSRSFRIKELNNSRIFAWLALPDADWRDIHNITALDRLCSERGISDCELLNIERQSQSTTEMILIIGYS